MALAPVLLIFSVGLEAVFVTVNLIKAMAPVASTKLASVTVLAAVPAAVEQVP